MDADVVVIGAGASGLACARVLGELGADVVVVEARNRLGGRIHTTRAIGDEPIEMGALVVHGERATTIDVVSEAGLTLGPPNWGSPGPTVLSVDGDVRPGRDLDASWWGLEHDVADLRGPDVPLDRFLRDAGWPDDRRLAADELFAQIWCADPQLLSAEGVSRVEDAWTSGWTNQRLLEGYDRVVEHMAHGLRVEASTPVRTVTWHRGHVRITATDGRSFDAGAAVVSVPPTVVAAGSLEFDPPLDAAKAEAARAIPLGGVIRVVAELRNEAPSIGSLIAMGREGGFWTVNENLVSVWIGGPSSARLSGSDPVEILLRARAAFPWLERERIGDVVFADWLADPFTLGGYSYPRAGALDAPAAWAKPVDQTLFFCGEATCGDVHPATVHGAIESGRRAGAEVAAVLADSTGTIAGTGP